MSEREALLNSAVAFPEGIRAGGIFFRRVSFRLLSELSALGSPLSDPRRIAEAKSLLLRGEIAQADADLFLRAASRREPFETLFARRDGRSFLKSLSGEAYEAVLDFLSRDAEALLAARVEACVPAGAEISRGNATPCGNASLVFAIMKSCRCGFKEACEFPLSVALQMIHCDVAAGGVGADWAEATREDAALRERGMKDIFGSVEKFFKDEFDGNHDEQAADDED